MSVTYEKRNLAFNMPDSISPASLVALFGSSSGGDTGGETPVSADVYDHITRYINRKYDNVTMPIGLDESGYWYMHVSGSNLNIYKDDCYSETGPEVVTTLPAPSKAAMAGAVTHWDNYIIFTSDDYKYIVDKTTGAYRPFTYINKSTGEAYDPCYLPYGSQINASCMEYEHGLLVATKSNVFTITDPKMVFDSVLASIDDDVVSIAIDHHHGVVTSYVVYNQNTLFEYGDHIYILGDAISRIHKTTQVVETSKLQSCHESHQYRTCSLFSVGDVIFCAGYGDYEQYTNTKVIGTIDAPAFVEAFLFKPEHYATKVYLPEFTGAVGFYGGSHNCLYPCFKNDMLYLAARSSGGCCLHELAKKE
jgi:hypothetical protein